MSQKTEEKKNFFGIDVEDVTQALLDLEDLQEQMRSGLTDKLFAIPKKSHASFKELLGDKYDPKIAEERISAILKRVLVDKMLLKDAIGLSAQSMEAFYYLGYSLFQADRLAEGFQLFKLLCALDPTEWKYLYAQAAVLHKQRNFQEAAKYYLLATAIHPQKLFPLGHFHSADCYFQLEDLTSAIVALGMAIESCDEAISEHRAVRDQAKDFQDLFQEQLRQQLADEGKEKRSEQPADRGGER